MGKHVSCRTHCCVLHGCKYGYFDCPVKAGKVQQAHLCEWCGDILDSEQRYREALSDVQRIKDLQAKLDKTAGGV